MPNLLSRGASWLADKLHDQESVSVTYRRGSDSVVVNATLGSQLLRVQDGRGNIKVERTQRDFIVRAADLILSGVVVTPNRGDKIDLTIGGILKRFEVMADGGEPHERYSDPYEFRWRIHTKFVAGVVTTPLGLTLTGAGTGQPLVSSWQAVAYATGYDVRRSPDGVTWTTVSTNQPGLSYSEPAQSGTGFIGQWYISVRATNSLGPSAWSAAVSGSPWIFKELWVVPPFDTPHNLDYYNYERFIDKHTPYPVSLYGRTWRFGGLPDTLNVDTGGKLWTSVTANGVMRLKPTNNNATFAHQDSYQTAHTIAVPIMMGAAIGGAGVIIAYKDDSNFIYWWLNDATGFYELRKLVGGSTTLLATSNLMVQPNKTYNLTLGRDTANNITGTVQDALTLASDSRTVNDAALSTATSCGFITQASLNNSPGGGSHGNVVSYGVPTITSPLGVPAMPTVPTFATAVLNDLFTDVDGTLPQNHTGWLLNTTGNSYVFLGDGDTPPATGQILGNRLRFTSRSHNTGPGFGGGVRLNGVFGAEGGRIVADVYMNPVSNGPSLVSMFGDATVTSPLAAGQLDTQPELSWLGDSRYAQGKFFTAAAPNAIPTTGTDAEIHCSGFLPLALGGHYRQTVVMHNGNAGLYTDGVTRLWFAWGQFDGAGNYLGDVWVGYAKMLNQLSAATALSLFKTNENPLNTGTNYAEFDSAQAFKL